jgi:POLQ-like helicase
MLAAGQKLESLNISANHKAFVGSMQKTAADYFSAHEYKTDEHYPYILKKHDDWKNNIILPGVADLLKRQKIERKLHRWIHHGLSSQAMLFNLVGPLVLKEDYEPLINVLEGKGIGRPAEGAVGIFEYENPAILNERKGQPTSVDFALLTEAKGSVFIEAKFTESAFGQCSKFQECKCRRANPLNNDNRCYYYSHGMLYWQLLLEHNMLDTDFQKAEQCPLAEYYQFYREVLFAVEQGGYFVLLHDERNPAFVNLNPKGDQGIFTTLKSRLPQNVQQKVASISVQELFHAIKESGRHEDWIVAFAEKYDLQ